MLPDDVPNDDIEPLVRNKGVALVDLQKLLGNGCDPHTAVKILA